MEVTEKTATDKDESFTWSWRPQRRLKAMDDALFDEGDDVIGDAMKQIMEPFVPCAMVDRDEQDSFLCQISGCGLRFASVTEHEMHYSNAHRNTCSECRRHFANTRLLDVHILESHNPMFASLALTQNMFSCLVEMCCEKFPSSATRRQHLVDVHKYPANFRFHEQRKQSKKKTSQKKTVTSDSGDAAVTSSSGDGQKQSSVSVSGRRFVYNVPKNICFGQGAQRGFVRPRGGRGRSKKHWHQTGIEPAMSKVNIDEVNMEDLVTALGTS